MGTLEKLLQGLKLDNDRKALGSLKVFYKHSLFPGMIDMHDGRPESRLYFFDQASAYLPIHNVIGQ